MSFSWKYEALFLHQDAGLSASDFSLHLIIRGERINRGEGRLDSADAAGALWIETLQGGGSSGGWAERRWSLVDTL